MTLCIALLSACGVVPPPAPPAIPAEPVELWVDFSKPETPRLEMIETGHVEFEQPLSHALLGRGWRDDDDKQLIQHEKSLWAASIVAELRLTVLRPRDLVLAMEMQQHLLKDVDGKELPSQKVDITWNKTPIGSCEFTKQDGWGLRGFSFDVPAIVQSSGINVVTFCSRYAVSAREMYGEGNDARRHAFGLKSIDLHGKELPQAATAPEHAAVFAPEGIRQNPGTRLTFPVRLPERGTGFFQVDTAPMEDCDLTLRVDSQGGPVDARLVPEPNKSGWFQHSLERYCGQCVEFVFETVASATGPVLWKAPRIMWHGAPVAPSEKPGAAAPSFSNVVLIVLDALRGDRVGDNGHYRATTPVINELARDGALFTRAYAAVPYTCSSTWCIETSLYAFQHGATGSDLAPSAPRLCEVLKKGGIVTGQVSANPLASHPEGFDEFIKAYEDLAAQPEGNPGLVTDAALDFIKRRAAERFFLHLHYRQPHAPYRAPAPDYKYYSADPANRLADLGKNWIAVNDERTRIPTPEQVLEIRARYDENTRAIDKDVGRIVEQLKTLALDGKTLVIVTSDHGEGFGEHENVFTHSITVYEPVMHVPLVLLGSGVQQALGPRVERCVGNIDVFPTVCAALDVAAPPTIAGQNLFTLPAKPADEDILAFGQGAWRNKGALNFATNHWGEAFWWQRYKLIRDNNNARVELYDLSVDAEEKGNIAVAFPVLTDYLLAQAGAWKQKQESLVTQPVKYTAPEQKVNHDYLKALGYL